MKLKVKEIPIETGGVHVAVLHEETADNLGVRNGDRIKISCKQTEQIAVVDTTHTAKMINRHSIGLFKETCDQLCVKAGKYTTVSLMKKPAAVFHIQSKLRGERLNQEQMFDIVESIIRNELTEIEQTYFVSASYLRELNESEIYYLAKAMIDTGEILQFHSKKPIVDKHCIGGVAGNRTTPIVVSILAAAGYIVPKTSSRSITSPSGTSDTIEVMANVTLSSEQVRETINKAGACLAWGGGLDLAPADDTIIRVERPMSLDPIGQLVASVLAKKRSVSASHVLIDIPVGRGAKIESMQRAKLLQKLFEQIGKKLGMKVFAIITDGREPIGDGIGPALEAKDILWTLEGHGSLLLRKKSISMAGYLFELLGEAKKGQGKRLAQYYIDSGKAHVKFLQILKAQGAKVLKAESIPVGKFIHNVTAKKTFTIKHIDNHEISRIARLLGAPFDKGAGIFLHAHVGDTLKKNHVVYTMYAEQKEKFEQAIQYVNNCNGID